MESKQYNGWTNYETWCVNLWLDNDPGSHDEWRERAQQAYDDADHDEDDAANDIAKQLESWHDEMQEACGMPSSGLFADLLGAALSEVNWREIADHFIADVDKPEPDEPDMDGPSNAERLERDSKGDADR